MSEYRPISESHDVICASITPATFQYKDHKPYLHSASD